MDKLKIKHDHKLTDILKVGLFGIFLLLPLLIWLPNALYFGFNENANNLTKTIAKNEIVDFNQNVKNGNFINNDNWDYLINSNQFSINDNLCTVSLGNYASPFYRSYQPINCISGHTYILSGYGSITGTDNDANIYVNDNYESNYPTYYVNYAGITNLTLKQLRFVPNFNLLYVGINCYGNNGTATFKNIQLFDLTQMFGSGNEPTLQDFNAKFSNEYYQYTQSKYIEIPTDETITVLAATDNMELAWQDVWKLPVLEWTGRNNFNFTINLFTNIFGITEYSYLTNYLTYLLVMTAIYVIFDIVLSMFKLVTHLINIKE